MDKFFLSTQIPIEAIDHQNLVITYVPNPIVRENIPVIQTMLEQVTLDWKTICKAYPSFAHVDDQKTRTEQEFEAFRELKPRLFQCLFSYVTFFFMAEFGYHFIYSELNRLKSDLRLRIHHNKRPKRTPFIESLRKLRNHSVAHWADVKEMDIADSIAGRQWGSAFGHKKHHSEWAQDMENIVPLFTGLSLGSIPEIHQQCSQYLMEFDQTCTDFLTVIKEHLPKTLNGVEYFDPFRRDRTIDSSS